jgi:hypothetical protein
LIVQQNPGQSSQVPTPLRAAEGSEQSVEERFEDVSPSTEHSSDYVLIPSSNKEPETQTVVN